MLSSCPVRFKLGDDLADALVHAVDHRRVDLHARGFPRLVRHLVPVAGLRRMALLRVDQARASRAFSNRALRIGS